MKMNIIQAGLLYIHYYPIYVFLLILTFHGLLKYLLPAELCLSGPMYGSALMMLLYAFSISNNE